MLLEFGICFGFPSRCRPASRPEHLSSPTTGFGHRLLRQPPNSTRSRRALALHAVLQHRAAPRASLLTGLYPHRPASGNMVDSKKGGPLPNELNKNCITIAQAVKPPAHSLTPSEVASRPSPRTAPSRRWLLSAATFLRHHPRCGQLGPNSLVRGGSSPASATPSIGPETYFYRRHQRPRGPSSASTRSGRQTALLPLRRLHRRALADARTRDIAKYQGFTTPAEPIARAGPRRNSSALDEVPPRPALGTTCDGSSRRCMEVYAR